MAHSQVQVADILQLAQVRVPCDTSADDDGGRIAKLLAREIDELDSLDALQLVNGQGVAVDTVVADTQCVTALWCAPPPGSICTNSLLCVLEDREVGKLRENGDDRVQPLHSSRADGIARQTVNTQGV